MCSSATSSPHAMRACCSRAARSIGEARWCTCACSTSSASRCHIRGRSSFARATFTDLPVHAAQARTRDHASDLDFELDQALLIRLAATRQLARDAFVDGGATLACELVMDASTLVVTLRLRRRAGTERRDVLDLAIHIGELVDDFFPA